MSRCTGHCCKGFTVSHPPGALVEMSYLQDHHGEQARLILSGLVYERYGENGCVYSCRYLAENGDCSIYGIRPDMCRDFPGQPGPCGFEGCTRDGDGTCGTSDTPEVQ